MARTRRAEIEVIAHILHAAKNQLGPTRLMYKANLSWKGLNTKLDLLDDEGLIQRDDRRRVTTTIKGIEFLKAYKQLYRVLNREPYLEAL